MSDLPPCGQPCGQSCAAPASSDCATCPGHAPLVLDDVLARFCARPSAACASRRGIACPTTPGERGRRWSSSTGPRTVAGHSCWLSPGCRPTSAASPTTCPTATTTAPAWGAIGTKTSLTICGRCSTTWTLIGVICSARRSARRWRCGLWPPGRSVCRAPCCKAVWPIDRCARRRRWLSWLAQKMPARRAHSQAGKDPRARPFRGVRTAAAGGLEGVHSLDRAGAAGGPGASGAMAARP